MLKMNSVTLRGEYTRRTIESLPERNIWILKILQKYWPPRDFIRWKQYLIISMLIISPEKSWSNLEEF